MSWNKKLWRVAVRLRAAYAARSHPSLIQLPATGWLEAQLQTQRLAMAEARGWTAAASRLRSALTLDLDQLCYRLNDLRTQLKNDCRRSLPGIRELYEELIAADAEFEGLQIDGGKISVTTEPIVLEDVRLGRFSIRLNTDQLDRDSPYSILALDPNPAASSEETTHPHVNAEQLCPGDGRSAITAALAEGRICDFFTIVDRILHTYAAGAAYVDLDRWYGTVCRDCDCTLGVDDAATCESCDQSLCNDCLNCCGNCSTGYCSQCVDRCVLCGDCYCAGCLSPCARCRRDVCESCLEDKHCQTCHEELSDEAEEELEPAAMAGDSPAKPAV